MVKGIFFNVPTSGHVNPSLPLTSELVRRGHQVIYYLTEGYRRKIEATGAEFRPYQSIEDDFFESRGLDGSNPPLSARYLIGISDALLAELVERIRAEQPAYIIYDSMCPWGYMIAQYLNVPGISSLSLLVFDPMLMIRSGMLFRILPTAIRGLPHIYAHSQHAKRISQKYKIPPLAFMDTFNAPADLTLCYTSAEIQPNAEKLDKSIKFVGPSIEPRDDDSGFSFEQLNDLPLIYISLGTVINDNPDFFRTCMDAFKDSPYQVVMSVGNKLSVDSLGEIPANFIVRNFVPQLKVLERAALFITHAGMNSVNEGLFYNVPLLLVPQQDEQAVVAARLAQLGVGLSIAKTQVTPENLRTTADRILHNTVFKQNAIRLGESLRSAGGHRRAADEIHHLLNPSTSAG